MRSPLSKVINAGQLSSERKRKIVSKPETSAGNDGRHSGFLGCVLP